MPFDMIITNDPDHGLTKDYIPIFKELSNIGVKTTTGVFCTLEEYDEYPTHRKSLAKHCYKGETHSLSDPEYRDLMLQIREQGHEIAYHGYSQISNTREDFLKGLEIYKDIFGEYPFTYIEHGGNPGKHDDPACKKETLDMWGSNKNSKYYVQDIIKEKISCTWAHHDLLDDKYDFTKPGESFYTEDGILLFKRHRMNYLPKILGIGGFWRPKNLINKDRDLFIGYTHFGYLGYRKRSDGTLESWVGAQHLKNAIDMLKRIIDHYNPKIYTIEEYVKNRL